MMNTDDETDSSLACLLFIRLLLCSGTPWLRFGVEFSYPRVNRGSSGSDGEGLVLRGLTIYILFGDISI